MDRFARAQQPVSQTVSQRLSNCSSPRTVCSEASRSGLGSRDISLQPPDTCVEDSVVHVGSETMVHGQER